jgi:hypothetical protein
MRVATVAVGAWAFFAAALAPGARGAEGDVRVARLAGAPVEGAFASVGPGGVVVAGQAPIPLDQVIDVRFPAVPLPKARAEGVSLRVHLRGGETLVGVLVAGDSEGVTLRPVDLPEARVPFDWILRIEVDESSKDPCAEPTKGRPPREGADVIHARSGDAFPGTLVSASAAGVVMETGRDRRQTVPWTDVMVLHLDEAPLPPAEGLVAEVETVGGSRLVAATVEGDARRVRVATRAGLETEVPVSSIAAIRWSGGSFVYASDLPHESTFEPFYGDDHTKVLSAWFRGGARVDRRPTGCPIRLGGTTYRHGFAVHSKSTITVPLGGAYKTFSAVFGIDDETLGSTSGEKGDVTARVLADGKEVWSSKGSVRGGEAPRTVGPVSVEGAQALVLEVDYGERMGSMDRADWADPILVRRAR